MVGIDLKLLQQGNRRALAKAITLTESSLDIHRVQAQKILGELLPLTGNSIRLGVSGVPGVGKSTFIESLGMLLLNQGKKVAVLAVDPSSPKGGGCILGDKTRMQNLSKHPNAFIRPSPSSGALGGVAHKTREAMLLCEAAGFDVIIVETVGVGQSEFEIAKMIDFFLVLMVPNAGDDLQGIKKGIMELVDAVVINKSDGDSVSLAKQTCQHYKNAFRLMRKNELWDPKILTCSAIDNINIDLVWSTVELFVKKAKAKKMFAQNRASQNVWWMRKLVHETIEKRMLENEKLNNERKQLESSVIEGRITAFEAANKITDEFFKETVNHSA